MNKFCYFAYGSNMNTTQMKKRCPNAEKLSKAVLYGYRFIINSRGVATIIESKNTFVEGGVYKVSDDCLSSLDRYEGVKANCYYRRIIEVIYQNEKIKAITYIATDQKESMQPRDGYIKKIIQGAKEFDLSEDYINNNFERYNNR